MQVHESEIANRFAIALFGRSYVGLNSINRAYCRARVREYLNLEFPLLGD